MFHQYSKLVEDYQLLKKMEYYNDLLDYFVVHIVEQDHLDNDKD